MTITFNTNLSALTAQRYIGIASSNSSSSLAKLSSGSRIPQAKDDAAGLAIGSKLKAEVAGLTQASNNASQATSLLQIADGALSTIGDILVRMKTLATQSSSGQLGNAERGLLNQEYSNLNDEIDRIAATSNFNGTALLAGSTTVGSNVNNLVSQSADNPTDATNLIGGGFESFDFNKDFGDGVVKVTYTASSRVLNVKNMLTGVNQDITLSATTLTVGQNETYNFGDVGVKVTINSQFDKSADVKADNAATVVTVASVTSSHSVAASTPIVSAGTGTPTGAISGITVGNFALTGTGTDAISDFQIAGDATIGGTAAAATAADIVINGHTFSTNGQTLDMNAASGANVFNYDDGQGNTFDLTITTSVAFQTGAMSGVARISVANTSTSYSVDSSAVVSSGTGTPAGAFGSTVIANTVFGGTGTNAFTADQLVGNLTFGGTAAAATIGTLTIGSHVFTSSTTSQDLTSVGTKTYSFSDGNGNSFDVVFDVNTAMQAGNMSGAAVISAGTTGGMIEATGNFRPAFTDINLDAGTGDNYYGNIASAKLDIDAATASAANATMVIGGITFSSTNTAAGGVAADLTSVGTKTITLASTTGNTITVAFNVTKAFGDGDSASLTMGEVGQYVAADSVSSGSTSFSFKVGTGTTSDDSIVFNLSSATTTALGIGADDILTATGADTAIGNLNEAISAVSSRRADVGANQSRLGFASANISVAIENTTAATSAIMDVDVSSEITKFTSQQVLLQAGISLEAQANQQPSLLLKLIQ